MVSTAIQASLSATRGKSIDRLAELHAALGIGEAQLERVLRHADGARRGLDARRFEGRHQLLEALALDAAEQVLGLHLEAVEGELVFLHAAIAEHADLAAGHASAGKGSASVPRGFSARNMERPAIAGLVRIGARQQRHQVGARRVGDPGLVAGDAVAVAVAHRAGAQAAEVRAGVGLGEHGGRQDLAGRELRQPLLLLRLGAAEADQLGRDLRAGAERAHADIAARQLLGHHAHRELAEAERRR